MFDRALDTQLNSVPSIQETRAPWLHRVVKAMRLAKPAEAVIRPRLWGAMRRPYGPFQFRYQVPRECEHSVEASTDLRFWTDIWHGKGKEEAVQYMDSAAYKFSFRFYRVRVRELLSENVVGYVAVGLPPGYSMISNAFLSSQTLEDLFPGWPDGTKVSLFDTSLLKLVENRLEHGKWRQPHVRISPGEGALFFNPSNDYRTAAFAGELVDGEQSLPIPPGFSIRGSVLPWPGALDELGFPLAEGDVVHVFDRERQQYGLHPFENGRWSNGPAVISAGEGFWIAKSKPAVWKAKLDLFQAK